MAHFIQITIQHVGIFNDEIIAQLAINNYDGFEEKDDNLLAFIEKEKFEEKPLQEVVAKYLLTYTKQDVPEQNWNALWESNFEPIFIDDFCCIRADFHSSSKTTKYEIVINPKMSFGTGHHATTYMMVQQMAQLNFLNKEIADFGTGTGVLAILAEKLGAQNIDAIDNDTWSITNAKENVEVNNCHQTELINTDKFLPGKTYDIILANINKNVILDNLPQLVAGLSKNGKILLSGLIKEDAEEMIRKCTTHNLKYITTVEKENWICLLFENSAFPH